MNPAVKDPSSVFIVGYGDIGQRVARLWQERGVPVSGLARSEAARHRMLAAGVTPVPADLDQPDSLAQLPVYNALVCYFAPPPARGQVDSRVQHFLASLSPDRLPARIVYISTSGVYGNHQGGWVSEAVPPRPQVDRARRRLDAEQQLRRFGEQHNIAVVTLRVGGIYGPGRLPEQRLRDGVPVLHESLAPPTNRIHADDLAQITVAAARRGRANGVYNVGDDKPGNMTEYFNAVADLLDLPRPPTIGWDEAEQVLSRGMLSYLKESRRLDTRRLKEELGVALRYPDLASGLPSCRPPA